MTIDTSKYKKQGNDVKGYWKPELGPIHCIPKVVKLFDGNITASKPSILIICELYDNSDAIVAKSNNEDDEDEVERISLKIGDRVGVWYKPGMDIIKTHCDVPVILQYERDEHGEIVTKKMKKKGMNPMKCFDVLSEVNPLKKIPVIEDSRRESAQVNTAFAGPKGERLGPIPISDPKSADSDDNAGEDRL